MPEATESARESFRLSLEAAEAYESLFVPRLFAPWSPHVVDAAGLVPGQRVLDVACGTGIVAREAADRVGPAGTVVGLDLNEAMLAVARRLGPELDWHQGDAAALPFADDSFDAVLCQAALMFFLDASRAVREMARVAAPGGTVVLQVWDRLENQPAYVPLVQVAARHAEQDAVGLIETYFGLGDLEALQDVLRGAGLEVSKVRTLSTTMEFASVDDFVATEVEATPLAERLGREAYERMLEDAREALAQFQKDGAAEIPIAGHIVTARQATG